MPPTSSRHVDRLHVQFLAAREGEHALGQGSTPFGALDGIVQQRHQRRIVGQPFLENFQAPQHGHQQIVEIMGDTAGQLADRLHLLGLEKLLARLGEGLLRLDLFGDIAGDLGEAEKFAFLVADRVDDHMCPETCAILALPPAFPLETALPECGLQAALRFAAFAVFGRIELRKMLADDFLRRIALDAHRAGVPVAHVTIRIEHVEGVVGDALDEELELLLACPQFRLGLLPFGQIAGHLGEAEKFAGTAPDRIDDDMGPEAGAVLADPPALFFEAAFGCGGAQRMFGCTRQPVFGRIEAGKVFAEDFPGLVPLEALRAGVPADDLAVRVDHVDRVVGNGIDEQAITFLIKQRNFVTLRYAHQLSPTRDVRSLTRRNDGKLRPCIRLITRSQP